MCHNDSSSLRSEATHLCLVHLTSTKRHHDQEEDCLAKIRADVYRYTSNACGCTLSRTKLARSTAGFPADRFWACFDTPIPHSSAFGCDWEQSRVGCVDDNIGDCPLQMISLYITKECARDTTTMHGAPGLNSQLP